MESPPPAPLLGCLRRLNRKAQARQTGGVFPKRSPLWLLFRGPVASAACLSLNPVSGILASACRGEDEGVDFP